MQFCGSSSRLINTGLQPGGGRALAPELFQQFVTSPEKLLKQLNPAASISTLLKQGVSALGSKHALEGESPSLAELPARN